MTQITESDFLNPSTTIAILKKGLHGGFIEESSFDGEEREFCEKADWIERVVKFRCTSCGNYHITRPDEEKCLRTQEPINPTKSSSGYRLTTESNLDIDTVTNYNLFISEHSGSIDTTNLPYKSIVFVPDKDEIVFSDRAGSIVFLPLEVIPKFIDPDTREKYISEIAEKREKLVDWKRLDSGGDDFQEITFRLVKRDDDYFNESWGGSGPDQGKDGFCSIDLGGRETRILVQAKFNNEGDPVNDQQVEKSCRKAERHDCGGVIIACVRTSGDLESEFEQGTFRTKNVTFLRTWPGPEVKEKLSKHPDLIAEFFLQ